jgi:hypothetical protein
VVVEIPKLSALRVTLPAISTTGKVRWNQFASPDVLQPLDTGMETTISLNTEDLQKRNSALLRLVVDRPQQSLTLQIGDNTQTLTDVPFGISDHLLEDELFQELQRTTTLRLENGEGILLASSLWLQK